MHKIDAPALGVGTASGHGVVAMDRVGCGTECLSAYAELAAGVGTIRAADVGRAGTGLAAHPGARLFAAAQAAAPAPHNVRQRLARELVAICILHIFHLLAREPGVAALIAARGRQGGR